MLEKFPATTANPFWTAVSADQARTHLASLERWRAGWVEYLGSSKDDDAMSEPMTRVLLELLGARDSSSFESLPYRLARFPAATTNAEPSSRLRQLFLWRAGIIDFLADVWDTIGDAGFDMEECLLVSERLTPEGAKHLCPYCLGDQEPAFGSQQPHYEVCAVQVQWRAQGPIG